MTTPRKTPNPWANTTNRLHQLSAWADGYKCGHSDAEMDARDRLTREVKRANEHHDELIMAQGTITTQGKTIDNLVEKNDEQVKVIERLTDTADWQESIIESHERAYASQRDKLSKLRKDNSARGGSIMDAQAKIRELEANVDGNKEMYDDGLRDGIDNAMTEMVTHMQSMGGTVMLLTAEQYSQLEGINAKIGAKTDDIELDMIAIDEQVTLLGEVLGDIEGGEGE